jgi:hypothetical protein
MYCIVKGCRFANSHVTKAHICGKCGNKGHGVCECGDSELITTLAQDTTAIPFDLQCCVIDCRNVNEHTTSGHQCTYCKNYEHDVSECPEQLWKIKESHGTIFGQNEGNFKEKKYVQIQARKQMKWEEKKIYTIVYAGMGCMWYAKRDNNWKKIKLFFIHNDNWGQYGPETDNSPLLEQFINGYRLVDPK